MKCYVLHSWNQSQFGSWSTNQIFFDAENPKFNAIHTDILWPCESNVHMTPIRLVPESRTVSFVRINRADQIFLKSEAVYKSEVYCCSSE